MTDNNENSSNSTNNKERAKETGALYALGVLTKAEEMAFENEHTSDSPDSLSVRKDMETVAALSELIAEGTPTPRRALKAKILSEIANTDTNKPNVTEQSVVRSDQGDWQTFNPGITGKILYFDESAGMYTVLARLEAGARYPRHKHVGIEQCMVLEGDLHNDGVDLKAGDFIATPDGAVHFDTHTVGGCVLLLNTTLQDEALVE